MSDLPEEFVVYENGKRVGGFTTREEAVAWVEGRRKFFEWEAKVMQSMPPKNAKFRLARFVGEWDGEL